MMRVRWKVFEFTFQIAEEDQEEVKPCGRCFADLVFNNFCEFGIFANDNILLLPVGHLAMFVYGFL